MAAEAMEVVDTGGGASWKGVIYSTGSGERGSVCYRTSSRAGRYPVLLGYERYLG